MSRKSEIEKAIDEVLRPLLALDGAVVDVVSITDDGSAVSLSLGGTLSGDPSLPLIKEKVIEPVVRRAAAGDVAIAYV